MNAITSIIETLTEEDKRRFIQRLKRKNKRNDTKNIELFQYFNSGKIQEDVDIAIYGKRAKGAYHALCKRLHDSLIDFVATKSFEEESSEEMIALKLVLASRIFFNHQKNEIAFKTLGKAELKAKKHSLYNILNEVYHTQIANAHLNENIDLIELKQNYQDNKEQILLEERLNLFYASVKKEIRHDYKLGTEILNRNLDAYGISISENLSYQSLLKILEICSEVAHVTRDYYAILDFVESACQKIEVSQRIDDKHLYDHIQVLYFLANTYFRIKKFDESKRYLEKMHSYMCFQNNRYFNVFYPQYTLILNLLLMYSGKANETILNLSLFDYEKYKKQLVYVLDLKLALVVALFFMNKFKEALKVYREFYHSDLWYTKVMGNIWVVKKNLMELLIFIELDELDLIESRLKSFRKKHRVRLVEYKESRVLDFLKFISMYYYKTEDIYTDDFKSNVNSILKIKSKEEDIFTLSFYAWFKSKLENTQMYETCLNYINNE